jgi:hypothetical protein
VVLVGGITAETFVPESLILPQSIPALCDDPGLWTSILATLPTLDKSVWRFFRPVVGTSTAGSGSQMHRLEVPSPLVRPPAPTPPRPPAPWTRVKGLQAAPLPQLAPRGRRRIGDAGCVALMGRSFRSLPRSARGPQGGSRR